MSAALLSLDNGPRNNPASLVARARRVAQNIAAIHADSVDREGRFPFEAIAALKEARLLGAMIPRSLGGEGASLIEIADICATLGRACASSAMIFAMHQIQVAVLVDHGSESTWHRALMSRIVAEQLLLASATTEAGVGGDVRNSICAIEPGPNGFRVRKDASVISYARQADAFMVTARRAPEAAGSDQVIVTLLKDQVTLEQTGGWDTLGMRGTCSEGFILTGEAPRAQIVPSPYVKVSAQSMLAMSHVVWGALWLGIAMDAVARAQAYQRAEARKKPTQAPIGQIRVAEAVALLGQMRAAVIDGIRSFDEAKACPERFEGMGFAVAMNNMKVSTSELVVTIVQRCLMVCGIQGYRNDTPYSLGRHLRDAYSAQLMINNDRIMGNTAQMLLMYKFDADLQEIL